MIYKELGKTGVKIPAMGLGTWGMGGREIPDYSRDDEYVEVIEKAIEIGITHIDTAEVYGSGHAEELVGEAIQKFRREDIFIVSKVSPTNLGKKNLFKALEDSLKRLKTDYMDLYLIHKYIPGALIEEALKTMAEAVDGGLIRYIGVSNFDKELLTEAIRMSPAPITCNQVHYNIEYRGPEEDGLLEFCQCERVTLTAYRPFQQGKIDKKIMPILEEIAKNHGATIYQTIIAWLLSKERVITIPKSSKIEHIKENIKALKIKLTEEEIKILDKIKIQDGTINENYKGSK